MSAMRQDHNTLYPSSSCHRRRMSIRSRHSRRAVPTNRSAMTFARGARTGVLMILMSSAVKTASKAGELRIYVTDEVLDRVRLLAQLHTDVAGRWVTSQWPAWRSRRRSGRSGSRGG